MSPIADVSIIKVVFVFRLEEAVDDWEVNGMIFNCRQSNRRQSLRREQNVDVGEENLKRENYLLIEKWVIPGLLFFIFDFSIQLTNV